MIQFSHDDPIRIDDLISALGTGEEVWLGEAYRVERQVTEGGMGAIFKAWEPALERPVAIKVLKEEFRHLLEDEAKGQAIAHANVCPIHHLHKTCGYFSMMWIEGRTIEELRASGASAPEILKIGAAISDALEEMRAITNGRIVHNDIHPKNVLIKESSNTPYLVDFSLCQRTGRPGQRFGVAGFMPPEKFRSEPLSCRSDIWSLGALLYYCLSGDTPFPCNDHDFRHPLIPITQVRPELPARLDDVLSKALALRAEDRYADPGALRDALNEVLNAIKLANEKPPLYVDTAILAQFILPDSDHSNPVTQQAITVFDRYVGEPGGIACSPFTLDELTEDLAKSLHQGSRPNELDLAAIEEDLAHLPGAGIAWDTLAQAQRRSYRELARRGYFDLLTGLATLLSTSRLNSRSAAIKYLEFSADRRLAGLSARDSRVIGEAHGFGSEKLVAMPNRFETAQHQTALRRAGVQMLILVHGEGTTIRPVRTDDPAENGQSTSAGGRV